MVQSFNGMPPKVGVITAVIFLDKEMGCESLWFFLLFFIRFFTLSDVVSYEKVKVNGELLFAGG